MCLYLTTKIDKIKYNLQNPYLEKWYNRKLFKQIIVPSSLKICYYKFEMQKFNSQKSVFNPLTAKKEIYLFSKIWPFYGSGFWGRYLATPWPMLLYVTLKILAVKGLNCCLDKVWIIKIFKSSIRSLSEKLWYLVGDFCDI